MKIIFMGTPEFAVPSLDILIRQGYDVIAVITAPDRPAGRGQQIQQSAVKHYALSKGLKILQPEKLKSEAFINELKVLNADLQIVVAFRMLPEIVWDMPKLGTYNLHASLLPKYRGAAPINWAIINGEKESGVTTFKLTHEIDAGNVLFQERVEIPDTMTAGELHDDLMRTGADLMLKTVRAIEKSLTDHSELKFIEQRTSAVTHAPKLTKDTAKINWNNSAISIYDLIRGLSPYPAAFTELRDEGGTPQSIKIFRCAYELEQHRQANGSLLTDNKNYLKICCSDGLISVTELQLQGKNRMQISDFLKGYKFKDGDLFV